VRKEREVSGNNYKEWDREKIRTPVIRKNGLRDPMRPYGQ